MPAKKQAGWYSLPSGNRAHWWVPWEANDYFLHARCGLRAFCASLREDTSHHQCQRCAKAEAK